MKVLLNISLNQSKHTSINWVFVEKKYSIWIIDQNKLKVNWQTN